jgi:hypothetical protein
MQVGRVVLILTEEESNDLFSVLESVVCSASDKNDQMNAIILKEFLSNAKRTILIDDFRPDKIDTLLYSLECEIQKIFDILT